MERSHETMYEVGLLDEKQLKDFALSLSKDIEGGEVIFLRGELGSGKTTFVKGFATGFGIDERIVRSPTFTIVNEYSGVNLELIHIDLYRLRSMEEVIELAIEDIIDETTVMVVEWPELCEKLFKNNIEIFFYHYDETYRKIRLKLLEDRTYNNTMNWLKSHVQE
ncbi:MAG: tRNA (adenosine(37)-N6)-threonylcarbamoyltransferase complex ATPase subunit type 1 TsaE [Thermotogota bacterium]|nr:tRNA (adenosine(37)-N6)-threonylcarbamoyltransferase complex ATPase subunit type 1 TsaE [Thermotogota bacterium]